MLYKDFMSRTPKEKLKQLYATNDRAFHFLEPFVRWREWLAQGAWRTDRAFISRRFKQTFGYELDWNTPHTLNEKLNWMKYHDRRPLLQQAADKYVVRDYVAEKAGADCLIPLLAVFHRAADIQLDGLPDPFILKVNHGSGQNYVVRNKTTENLPALRRQFHAWMKTSQYPFSREWPYKQIKPVIIAEELLLDEQGRLPVDYKFHCFNGRVEFIQMDMDRETRHRRNFYSRDWQLMPFIWTEWEGNEPLWPNGEVIDPPDALADMIRLAETLAADFPYARIDLYYCRGRINFGEITFYHGSGLERFDPPEWDATFGGLLRLEPCASTCPPVENPGG